MHIDRMLPRIPLCTQGFLLTRYTESMCVCVCVCVCENSLILNKNALISVMLQREEASI